MLKNCTRCLAGFITVGVSHAGSNFSAGDMTSDGSSAILSGGRGIGYGLGYNNVGPKNGVWQAGRDWVGDESSKEVGRPSFDEGLTTIEQGKGRLINECLCSVLS